MTKVNEMCEYLKDAIEDGIDANGSKVNPSVTPTYGGTSASEDFAGMYIYVNQLNDTIRHNVVEMPCLMVDATIFSSQERMFDDEITGMNINISVFVTDTLGTLTIGEDEYTNMKVINIYVERLIEFLKRLRFTPVRLISRDVASPLDVGSFLQDNMLVFSGGASLTIEYIAKAE